jgi:hypothetical protein
MFAAQLEWALTDHISIPFSLIYKQGVSDIKNLNAQITIDYANPPVSQYWSSRQNSFNPFLVSSFTLESGLIYKFSNEKKASAIEDKSGAQSK